MKHRRVVSTACAVSLLLAGCGGSGGTAANSTTSVPTTRKVVAAMSAQPRIIVTLIGSPDRVARVVVDTKARYQAIFSASGKLLDLDKGGIEYRRVGTCFRRFKASRMIRSAEWTVSLTEPGHPHYTTKVSGGNVLFNSSSERVTVDARTYLLRRDITPADPRAGVPYQSASFSYPASVAELKAPGVCS